MYLDIYHFDKIELNIIKKKSYNGNTMGFLIIEIEDQNRNIDFIIMI
jgi:hypothetical protein